MIFGNPFAERQAALWPPSGPSWRPPAKEWGRPTGRGLLTDRNVRCPRPWMSKSSALAAVGAAGLDPDSPVTVTVPHERRGQTPPVTILAPDQMLFSL
jgi:hypothetical protein